MERLKDREVGEAIRGDSKKITENDLDTYCNVVGLKLKPFMNDEAARKMGFKSRLVPGPFMFSLVFALLGERIEGLIHLGTEKLKVFAPLFLNEEVTVEVKVVEKRRCQKEAVTF